MREACDVYQVQGCTRLDIEKRIKDKKKGMEGGMENKKKKIDKH